MGIRRIKIKWKPYAMSNLHSIRTHIAKDSIPQANRIFKILRAEPNRLKVFPEIGNVVGEIGDSKVREILCFSWRIFYKYIENEKTVYILSVFHSARELDENIINEITKEEQI